ncbi:MAG: proline--tRNA ligase [Gammaproteobacteria bacterium]|nr:proline--tRNA ligase [Gammaproteobacteria bacterium]MBU0848644.1 proline--tRNA ligase [Gammaproteobacteria bacterium]MBU1267580.1 proline--tRNA ligase [Gammaproteobacteria bacterium]MBU1530265.1 proline--tRNA ligase [Gammaproteobacteria bacterium]MBU1780175.1 proline--tRNA ligase [Gammaproteobacteria bacterium]
MRATQFFLNTLKEAPADAEVISHQLMMRAGMIKRLAGGIYTYMPVGLRSIRKVENIVREEMNRAGALELLMPAVQPAELWQESGRWEKYGPELLRMKDRHDRDYVIGPTHEEVITDVVRKEVKSYRQLPLNLYQIQTKFRDEIRPRFGVMRGREFVMKDAYSFDRNQEAALKTYDVMYDAYRRIFTRLGLNFRAVNADTGSIGGNRSHEFHVIADTGEDAIAYCPSSDYAANVELAEAVCNARRPAAGKAMEKVHTPGNATCEAVAAQLGLPLAATVKSVVFANEFVEKDETKPVKRIQIVLALVRGDHEVNDIKLGKLTGVQELRLATEAEIVAVFGTKPGYLGPVGLTAEVRVVADRSVAAMGDFVCGANAADYHHAGVNWGRDLPEPEVADIRNVVQGDASPDGKGVLALCRGIEVGHVFYLGTKYSEALQAKFLEENGKPAVIEMGCYGIGVTRILGAAIEQNFDDRGIVWPLSIAPFEVVLCPIGYKKSDEVKLQADKLYQQLKDVGVDVILDDRDERPGVMFADWELIGVPLRVTFGDRGLKEGKVEFQSRDGKIEKRDVDVGEIFEQLRVELASRQVSL